MNKITAFIPARGGSKGIPDKNIKIFAGKPLLVHSIEYALESSLVTNVVVSTDNEEICQIAKDAGATILMRPDELASDSATTESAITHFLNEFSDKPDIVALLQATSPLRPKNSLDDAVKHFINENFDSLLSICPTHRFFWRVNEDNTTYAEYDFINRPRRQDLKSTNIRFVENGSLYMFSRTHFEKNGNRLGGKIGYVEWPEECSIEIDTLTDFKILENIFLKK